jgi:hypothetical protein
MAWKRKEALHADVVREVAIEIMRELRAVLRPLRLRPVRALREEGVGFGVPEANVNYLSTSVCPYETVNFLLQLSNNCCKKLLFH